MCMPDKGAVCCFTGHRLIQVRDLGTLQQRIEEAILDIARKGVTYFVCGGARGFDMLAGFTVLELKREHPEFRLILVLPCHDQHATWSQNERFAYRQLTGSADDVTYLAEQYTRSCFRE